MRFPSPDRVRTTAGILVAVAVLLLAGDLAVVQQSGRQADVVPFFVQADNVTVSGFRVTNAGSHDIIRITDLWANSACGGIHFYDDPSSTPPGGYWIGNVTLVVLESLVTSDFIRGLDVPTYLERNVDSEVGTITMTGYEANRSWEPGEEKAFQRHAGMLNASELEEIYGGNFTVTTGGVSCRWDGAVVVQRGPHPGTNVRSAFSSSEPWVQVLPQGQGVDFLFVLRAQVGNDPARVVSASDTMRRDAESYLDTMNEATVFDDEGLFPDRLLRGAFLVVLAAAVLLLVLSLRREAQAETPLATDAALALAAAGEGHLVRLRQTWVLVGALLVPMLAAATYVTWALDYAPPWPGWEQRFLDAVIAVDVVVMALWGLATMRVHRDLVAWRQAWTRLDATDLDAL